MSEFCPVCGQPKELCVCGQIAKESQKIKVRSLQRRFGKKITQISGLELKELKELNKKLKKSLACGGTVKGNTLELQGEHRKKVKELLLKEGYKEELIEEG